MSSSSSSPAAFAGSSSTSSSSLYEGPATDSLISALESSSPSSERFSGAGSFDSIASRSRISRSCISSLLSASDHWMIAWKVIGLSHRPRIMVSRPASIRLAMAISPSRLSSSTAPISRRYMRTGSSVRSTVSFFFTRSGRSAMPSGCSSTSSTSFSSGSTASSSLSTMLTPISLIADMMSSIWSEDIWSCGSASLSSSMVITPRRLARAISFLIEASLRSISGAVARSPRLRQPCLRSVRYPSFRRHSLCLFPAGLYRFGARHARLGAQFPALSNQFSPIFVGNRPFKRFAGPQVPASGG